MSINQADRLLPVLLRVHRLWREVAAKNGGLLRVLLLWLSPLPARSECALRQDKSRFGLRDISRDPGLTRLRSRRMTK